MSEPVQANQPAPAGTDPQTSADEAVAAADAAVSAADLDAVLAEVDKMQTTTVAGEAVATAESAEPASSSSDATFTTDGTAGEQLPPEEPAPSQEQLDDIARQVEETVFGDGSMATDSVTSAQPVLNTSQTDMSAVGMADTTQAAAMAMPPAPTPRPVAPAPTLPSFLPTSQQPNTGDGTVPQITQGAPLGSTSVAQNQNAGWQGSNQPQMGQAGQFNQANQFTQQNQSSFAQPGQYQTTPVTFNQPGSSSLAQQPAGLMSLGQGGMPGMTGPPGMSSQQAQFGQYGSPPQGYGGMPGQYNPGMVGNLGQSQNMSGFGGNQMGQTNQLGQPGQFTAPTAMQMASQPQMWPNQPYMAGMTQGQSSPQGQAGFSAQQPGAMQQPGLNQQPGMNQQSGAIPSSLAGQQPAPMMQPAALVPGTVISGPGSQGGAPSNPSSPTPPTQPADTAQQASPPSAVLSALPTQSQSAPAAAPTSNQTPAVSQAKAPSAGKSADGKIYSNLIDVLTDMAVLTTDQLTQLKQDFLTTGRNYEDLLVEKKWLSEENLARAKAKLNNTPYITLSEIGISPEALSKLDESVARRYGILPFAIDKTERKLSVAMKNPLDVQAIAFAEQKTGYHLVVHYSSPTEVERMITERYAQNLSSEVDEALKDTEQSKVRHKKQDQQLNDFGGVIRDAPINRIVETILEFAVKSRASDIHIEPMPNKVRVRYRIDGILVEKLVLPRSVIDAVVSRIKILGNMKIDEKRIPQDGRFNYSNDESNVDLRVSTIPTVNGEKVNMRLLEKNLNVPTMEQLGLDGLSLANVREAIKVPHGIILISGPTGSGKTTTLYALLNILNTPRVNIVTLEDPVEYQMLGVNQVQINPKAGLTFATGLRAFLRQDPNIVMVGEMRDSETTGLAIQASLTGHLVFSTIHTSSAATALPRMVDMGAENFLIASSVTMIIAQRVVRKINQAYREEYVPDPAVVADIAKVLGSHFDSWLMQHGKTPQTLTLFRPSANRPENEPEYLGRVAIYEVLRMTEAIGRMVLQNRPASEIEQEALRNGMLLMKQDGYVKALNGITTIEEVLRVAEV